jgi:hypothetical protein
MMKSSRYLITEFCRTHHTKKVSTFLHPVLSEYDVLSTVSTK